MYTIGAYPDHVRAFYDRKIEIMLANLQLYAQAVGDNIDIFGLGEDFGTQKADDLPADVPGDGCAGQMTGACSIGCTGNTSWSLFPLLRWDGPDHRHPDRLRRGYPEPGADLRRRDGAGKVETGVRGQAGLLRCTTTQDIVEFIRRPAALCHLQQQRVKSRDQAREADRRVERGQACIPQDARDQDLPLKLAGIDRLLPEDLAHQPVEGKSLGLSDKGVRPSQQLPSDLLRNSGGGHHDERAPGQGLLPPGDHSAQLPRIRGAQDQVQTGVRRAAGTDRHHERLLLFGIGHHK